jgi:hypothetical protein
MKRLLVTALILAVSAPACKTGGSGHPDADAQSDAGDAQEVTPGDVHDPAHEPHCCPLDVPSCDCTHVGGAPDERGECATVCNVRPEGWMRMIDDDGCFYWHIPDDAPWCGEEGEEEPEPAEEVEEGPEPPPDADTG